MSGGPYNHAADWWSLGIMLFSLATGKVKTLKLTISLALCVEKCLKVQIIFALNPLVSLFVVSTNGRSRPLSNAGKGQRFFLCAARDLQLCSDPTPH